MSRSNVNLRIRESSPPSKDDKSHLKQMMKQLRIAMREAKLEQRLVSI